MPLPYSECVAENKRNYNFPQQRLFRHAGSPDA